jgi:hypothetical protein
MNAVTICTYLRLSDGTFVPLTSVSEGWKRDTELAGAVEILVGSRPLLTRAEWDDVDWLWGNLANIVLIICEGGRTAETTFPDQPIPVRLTAINRSNIEATVTVGGEVRIVVADKRELLVALCSGGIFFYEKLEHLGWAEEEHRGLREIFASCLGKLARETSSRD